MALALLGVGGTFTGLIQAPAVLAGAEIERPEAVLVQSVMALLCIGYVIAGVGQRMLATAPVRRSPPGGRR